MVFSIIVAVYDVEQYLKICVDSILAQTVPDFEVILVDDGSPDGAPALCDAYAARDSRVRVIHQANAGVVGARRTGLSAASGRYILFVDGDDWISPRCLARGRELLEETQAELVIFAVSREYGDCSETACEPVPEGLYDRAALRDKMFPALLMDARMRHMSYSPFCRLLRRDLAEKGFLSVSPRITLGEDLLSILPAFLEAQNVYVSHEAMYFYRIRERSASHGFRMEHYRQIILVLEALGELKEQYPSLPRDFDRQMDRYGAYMCFTLIVHAANDGCRPYLREIREWMDRPQLSACIRRARFRGITVKTRITYALLRRNRVSAAYGFLRLCRGIKSCLRRNRNG